jgi:hypothetical protein
MMKFRLFLFVLFIIGMASIGLFIHESVHLLQGYLPKWEMCLTNDVSHYKAIAFVTASQGSDYVAYLSKEQLQKDEIVPNICIVLFWLICVTYVYFNYTVFIKHE